MRIRFLVASAACCACLALSANDAHALAIDGLIGHWKFNESTGTTAADSSGSAIDHTATQQGTWAGDNSEWGSGFIGGAVDLAHTGSDITTRLNVPEGTNQLGFVGTSFSVAGWVNLNSTANHQNIFGHGDNGADWFSWGLGIQGTPDAMASEFGANEVGFFLRTGSGPGNVVEISGPISAGAWTHVAGVFDDDADTIELFVNGISQGTTAFAGSIFNSPSVSRFGSDDNRSPLNGLLDDFGAWNRALTLNEINQIYDTGVIFGAGLEKAGLIPEPSTGLLLVVGLMGVSVRRNRHRRQAARSMRSATRCLLALPLVAAMSAAAPAAIVDLAVWQLGEAGSLGTNNRPQDSIGSEHFTSDIAGASTTVVNDPDYVLSTAALNFTPNQGFFNVATNFIPTNNFAIEMWVRTDNPGQANNLAIFNSGGGGSRIDIGVQNGNWAASISGAAWIGATAGAGQTITADAWTHLAVIRDSGVSTLYIDGVAQAGTPGSAPIHSSQIHLGVQPGGTQWFDGDIDHVRIFSFNPATDNAVAALSFFDYAVPEPSTAMLGAMGLLGLAARRRRRGA
ncbi:MAG: PEP-CTERM sorting domain-containing protein [Planctomycetales bacterium]|nr:PEP-CTERM sorting domain-containing protein [Planctomycetales bacterium]